MDAVYSNFSKAFDKIDRGILLDRLAEVDVGGELLVWMEPYFTKRLQYVESREASTEANHNARGTPRFKFRTADTTFVLIIQINITMINVNISFV